MPLPQGPVFTITYQEAYMKIGCPKEIKSQEFRVGIIPAAVKAYVDAGHEVFVQEGAGIGSGIADEQYQQAGARICRDGG